jgi:hypothetical protein
MVDIQASKHTEENYGGPHLAPVEVIVATRAISAKSSENQVFRHQAIKNTVTTCSGALLDSRLCKCGSMPSFSATSCANRCGVEVIAARRI